MKRSYLCVNASLTHKNKLELRIFLLVFLVWSGFIRADDSLTNNVVMGFMAARDVDRDLYLDLLADFRKKESYVKIDYLVANDKDYKVSIHDWLINKQVDVAYGQSSHRFCRFAKQGEIAPLDQLWQTQKWDKSFSKRIKASVSCDNKVYGVPLAYYYWGIFYKKSLFKKLNLSPPQTWAQFLSVGNTLKKNGITPFTLGSKNAWPAAAWFDYINLRVNGLKFHKQLLAGELSFRTQQVNDVLVYWKSLIESDFFLSGSASLNWRQSMPFLYREIAGMTLVGSFVVRVLPKHLEEDIGFFRFPQILENMPMYENVPTDLLMLNVSSESNIYAKKLLSFFATPQVQKIFSERSGYFAPNQKDIKELKGFTKIGAQLISQTDGYAQYFDRDAHPILASKGPKILADFLINPDIQGTLDKLEKLRLSITTQTE
jgi:multiple sugar transport system substrate-binding protein